MKRSHRLVWSRVSAPSVLALCLLAFYAVAVHAQTPQLRDNLISIVTDAQASGSIGNDPGETQNLYNDPKHRDVRDRLQQRLTAWQQSIGDPLLARPHRPQ